jgi:hypothetical protein
MLTHRSFFEIQGAFAERAAIVLGIPMHESLRLYTTFYGVARDNDAGVPPEYQDFSADHPRWVALLDAMGQGTDPVEYVYQHQLATARRQASDRCFEYDYFPQLRWVRLHFGNSPDGLGLRPHSVSDRYEELRRIFIDVSTQHADAEEVRGCSWLYHVHAYRSLFPSEFIAGMSPVGYLYQFAALWGQFLDRRGNVKEHLSARFIADIGVARTLHELNAAFPNDVLGTTCPIDIFYRHSVSNDEVTLVSGQSGRSRLSNCRLRHSHGNSSICHRHPRRLPSMVQVQKPLNRFTAEVVANRIADRPPTDLHIIDLDVVAKYQNYVINIAYELRGEAHNRVLRSVGDVLGFRSDPIDFTCNSSPHLETSDTELL